MRSPSAVAVVIEKLLTTKEVGRALRIAERTVRDLIEDGSLIAVRVAKRKWAVEESELEKYVAARRTTNNVVRLINNRKEEKR